MSDSSGTHHLRQKSSSSYINFSRPRAPLSSEASRSSDPPLSPRPSQSSLNGIDPSLIPAPLQLRRPASQTPLQPQTRTLAQTQIPAHTQPLPIPHYLRPRESFQSQATFGTEASSDESSFHNSNLSSTDHFNLYYDPEQDNDSEITEPLSEQRNEHLTNTNNLADQFQLEDSYPTSLSSMQHGRADSMASTHTYNLAQPTLPRPPVPGQFQIEHSYPASLSLSQHGRADSMASERTFNLAPPPLQPPPLPDQVQMEDAYPAGLSSLQHGRADSIASAHTFNLAPPSLQPPPPPPLRAKQSGDSQHWTKGDAWYPPRHPRIVKRVSFDRMSERLPPNAASSQEPQNPQVRATRSLEYNRQGSFGSFNPETTSTSSDDTVMASGPGNSNDTLSGNGTGLKRQWSSSNYDVSTLGEKKLAQLKKKGINPALYMEMQEARRGKNGKRRWMNPLVGTTYIG